MKNPINKKRMLIILPISLIIGLSLAIIVMSAGIPIVLGQIKNPKHQGAEEQDKNKNPFKNEELPAQSQYNKFASQKLEGINTVLNKTLPKSTAATDTGTEEKHKNDWVTVNHDIYYTRSSPQTVIGKDNVNKLQVKWMLLNLNVIEQPPIIIGDKGYVQDNKGRVIAFDANTGLNLWKVETGEGATLHGLTYDHGIIFAPTGSSSTIVAINATDGKIVWKSKSLAPDGIDYEVVSHIPICHMLKVFVPRRNH